MDSSNYTTPGYMTFLKNKPSVVDKKYVAIYTPWYKYIVYVR